MFVRIAPRRIGLEWYSSRMGCAVNQKCQETYTRCMEGRHNQQTVAAEPEQLHQPTTCRRLVVESQTNETVKLWPACRYASSYKCRGPSCRCNGNPHPRAKNARKRRRARLTQSGERGSRRQKACRKPAPVPAGASACAHRRATVGGRAAGWQQARSRQVVVVVWRRWRLQSGQWRLCTATY